MSKATVLTVFNLVEDARYTFKTVYTNEEEAIKAAVKLMLEKFSINVKEVSEIFDDENEAALIAFNPNENEDIYCMLTRVNIS